DDYAKAAVEKLRAAGIRAELDVRNEKINYKVREHSLGKVPNLLVVGRREADEGTVALRELGKEGQSVISLDDVITRLANEAKAPDMQ
ncbi:His/Gly/Thr/Pro-type tRNA ligase C-terminal domain-containing protein, partial [Sphingobium sp.]|uniref:His/Gly/Thr/Pro-type tRNA ligase C-terminal domain-containing protein n=1 Tax=Sphingobium sp. TaxID=1912891 RepID=UPI002BE4F386